MIKKSIYPKTKRVKMKNNIVVTEKLDGSNLGLFNLDGELVIAQRGTVYKLSELEEVKGIMYKGLYAWLLENGQVLLDNLHDGSGIFGEWIGMGQIKYRDTLDKKFYMFAKANITEELNVKNLNYDIDLFKYPFIDMEVPEFVGVVPIVAVHDNVPTKEQLDLLYENYWELAGRNVEGFIINTNGLISKYVRMKNGKMKEHHE